MNPLVKENLLIKSYVFFTLIALQNLKNFIFLSFVNQVSGLMSHNKILFFFNCFNPLKSLTTLL